MIEEAQKQASQAKKFDCTVFMYSLGHGVNERKIFDFFCEKSKNCCYVEFNSKEKAELAIGLNGKKLCGVPCQIVASQAEKNRYALAAKYKKLSKQPTMSLNIRSNKYHCFTLFILDDVSTRQYRPVKPCPRN